MHKNRTQCIFIKVKVMYMSAKGALSHYQRKGSRHLNSFLENMYCSTLIIPLHLESKTIHKFIRPSLNVTTSLQPLTVLISIYIFHWNKAIIIIILLVSKSSYIKF